MELQQNQDKLLIEKQVTQSKCSENKRKAEAFIDKRNKNKKNLAGQVYQDCRGSTWCPACKFYKQKLHKCKENNLWINIDTYNKLVIACNSISDIQCTNEEDRNFNTIVYYRKKEELLDHITTVADEHNSKKSREKEIDKRIALEAHFKKPYEEKDPAQYNNLRLVHTTRSKLTETPTTRRELLFYDGDYAARIIPIEEIQQ